MDDSITLLEALCLACVAASFAGIAHYLWKKPALNLRVKLQLGAILGLLPLLAGGTSTATGMQATTERKFCGSCHTMDLYVADASDPESQSLAARHGRNPFFGQKNCYTCHADYGMYGYPLTKLNGMGHVYEFYLNGWSELSIEESQQRIHLQKPYDNTNCRQCHTGTLADWAAVPEHVSLAGELKSNRVSCASSGCHGYAHPFSKKDGAAALALPRSAIGPDRAHTASSASSQPSAAPAPAASGESR